jgi:hypothetical protein
MDNSRLLNRRQLIHTAVGATAAPLLAPFLDSKTGAAIPDGSPDPHSLALAVVFHGLFAFLFGDQGQDISVVIPEVSGHVYWAGDFGSEDQNPLAKARPLQVTGVSAGNWKPFFDFPYLPLTVKNPSVVYTTLTLPWPDSLVLDRLVPPQLNKDFFIQPPGLKPMKFPTIYSFLYYDSSITKRPALSGTSWQAPRTWGQAGGATHAAVHIRAEHCQMTMTSGWDVFNALFGLTGASQKIVFNDGDYGKSIPGPANGVTGVVSPSEDDFLTEEPGCTPPVPKPGTVYLLSTPVNCASIGGKKGP